MIDNYCICCTGQVRPVNQDSAGCFLSEDCCLGYVADGMGGHYAGERASEIVAQACSHWWTSFINAAQRPNFLQSVEQISQLLRQSHEEMTKIPPANTICGTTAVLLWIAGGKYALFSVGDSRCYAVFRRFGFTQRPVQLTHDDVAVEPHIAGKLTQALGAGTCSFSLKTGFVRSGTLFALCSDGIYKFCPDLLQELRTWAAKGSLKETADHIESKVNKQGAPDNYSLLLLRV